MTTKHYPDDEPKFVKKLVRWTSQLITVICIVFAIFMFTRGAENVEEAGHQLTITHGLILLLIVVLQNVGERMFRHDIKPTLSLFLMASGPILLAIFFLS